MDLRVADRRTPGKPITYLVDIKWLFQKLKDTDELSRNAIITAGSMPAKELIDVLKKSNAQPVINSGVEITVPDKASYGISGNLCRAVLYHLAMNDPSAHGKRVIQE